MKECKKKADCIDKQNELLRRENVELKESERTRKIQDEVASPNQRHIGGER